MNTERNRQKFLSYLPSLTADEQSIIDKLPTEYHLTVPYHAQEQQHYSGAAVAQMIHEFHNREIIPQAQIAKDANLEDWTKVNHETLKEDFVRYMADWNYVPAVYYPGRYVLPQFPSGVDGADFIASNYEMVNDVGFQYFKALLVETKSPVMVRIHFNTDMYPMPEEMAQVLDTCGHALLIVGYNEQGFIVHDPWDVGAWGGTHGGANQFCSYEDMASHPTVNCCLGMVSSYVPFRAKIDYPRMAIHQNREIEIVLHVDLPGVFGITSDIYPINLVHASLTGGGKLSIPSAKGSSNKPTIFAGQKASFTWKLHTGPDTGSFPLEVDVEALLQIPAFGWEKGAKNETKKLRFTVKRRLDVKDLAWLNKYGR